MHNKEREQQIISIINRVNGFVTVKYLCDTLFASESSIRRDLKSLEEQGLIEKSYGGASPAKDFSNIVTFSRRTQHNENAKKEIARKAASLVNDGDIIFLDQSSTTFYLAKELAGRKSLTVISNSIEIIALLSESKLKVVSSGGMLSEENRNCLIGYDAQKVFEGVLADAVFFSVKAITDEGVAVDCSSEEVAVRNAMIQNADKTILLCDSSKFGMRAPYKQCTLADVDYLISEADCATRFSQYQDKTCLL